MAQCLYTRALDHFISFLAVKDRILVQNTLKCKEEFIHENIKMNFLIILTIYLLILLTLAISPYVIVSGYDNSLSRILFFESMITTNLIVPFVLNTIYLLYLLFKAIMSNNKDRLYMQSLILLSAHSNTQL